MFCLCVSLALAGARCTLEKQLRNQVIYKFDLEDHFLFARGNACKCLPTSTTYERNANISLATASLNTMCGWLRGFWPPSETTSHLSFVSEGTNSQARSCQLGFLRHILCGSSECAMHNEGIYINNFRLVYTRYNHYVTISLPLITVQSWSQQREQLQGLGRGGLGCPWPRLVRRFPFSAKTL